MPDTETAGAWRGHELIDRDGEKIGKIAEVYLDQHTGEPAWVTVKTGLFGNRHSLVPIGDALSEGKIVRVPFGKEHVEGSPNMDPDTDLSASEERELYDHYGVDYSSGRSDGNAHGDGGGHGEHEHGPHPEGHEPGGEHDTGVGEADPAPAATDEQSHERFESGRHRVDEPSDARQSSRESSASEHGRREDLSERVAEPPVGGEGGETRLRLKRYVVADGVTVPIMRVEVEPHPDDETPGPEPRV